jgi:serralysin
MQILPVGRRYRTPLFVCLIVLAAAFAGVVARQGGGPRAGSPAPSAAEQATTVSDDGRKVSYAGGSRANHLLVSEAVHGDNIAFTLHDRVRIGITGGSGCRHSDAGATTVVCTVRPPDDEASDLEALVLHLDGGDDRATVDDRSVAYSAVYGGPGDDIILATGRDVLYGGDGDDLLDGGGGAYGEGAHGGSGDDTVVHCTGSCED